MNCNFSEERLSELRSSVGTQMGEKRYRHTLEVEKMAVRIGEIYAPEKIPLLRAAALLHDLTKERSTEEHIEILRRFGAESGERDRRAPKLLHARTAALLIPERYPDLASPELVDAVRYHTTGRENMSIAEKIIYLADYIDMSRAYEDCVALRNYFFDFDFDCGAEAREAHLRDTLIMSYNLTIAGLLEDGKLIDESTVASRNYLISEK